MLQYTNAWFDIVEVRALTHRTVEATYAHVPLSSGKYNLVSGVGWVMNRHIPKNPHEMSAAV